MTIDLAPVLASSPADSSRTDSATLAVKNNGNDEAIKVVRVDGFRGFPSRAYVPDFDAFLRFLGSPGRYQILQFILLSLSYVTIAPNNLAMVFMGAEPKQYWCTSYKPILPASSFFATMTGNGNINFTDKELPSTEYQEANVTYYPDENQQCTIKQEFDFPKSHMVNNACNNWSFPLYDNGSEPATIVTSFQLMCDNHWQVSLANTIYFLGVMVGSAVFGYLADRYGRRKIVLSTGSAAVILGVAASFSQNYIVFVILRFILGMFIQGLQSFYVLVMEWFPVEKRGYYGTMTECFWAVGVMSLALFAYVFPHWNDLQLTIALFGLLLVTVYFFVIEESLRWLLSMNHTQEATDVTLRVLRFNKIAKELSWETEHQILTISSFLQKQKAKVHYTFLDCFRSLYLRKVSLCMTFIWFSAAMGYYGLSFSINQLVGNTAFNLFLAGLLEMIPYVACIFVIPRYGRKRPMMACNFLGGFACIVSCLVRGSGQGAQIGKTVLTLLGRMAISGSFCSFLVWTVELYPTVIRSKGVGLCFFALRIGGVLASQLLLLGRYTFKEFPVVVLGVFALAGVLAAYLLPETLHQNLPDTIEEAEKFGHLTGCTKDPVQHTRSDSSGNGTQLRTFWKTTNASSA